MIATSTRIAAAKGNDLWLRIVMLAPSASTSMFTTVLGDTDMTLMQAYFAKPQAMVTMGFSDDPQLGLIIDHFTGSAAARLATTSFVMRPPRCARHEPQCVDKAGSSLRTRGSITAGRCLSGWSRLRSIDRTAVS